MLLEEILKEILIRSGYEGSFQYTQLSGGDINDVYKISFDAKQLVIKINNKNKFPRMLEKESQALSYFQKHVKPLNYAVPVQHGEFENQQFLILAYEQPSNSKLDDVGQRELGIGLAEQHRITNELFGWKEDNYIGSLPQINSEKDKWSDFYAEYRILFQAKMAFDNGELNRSELKRIENFCNYITEIYPDESPALLHGDLWGGNYFIGANNKPFLYDPAIYFGHREMDIAMTQLFGGFSELFLIAYNQSYPLEKGWEERLKYSQLYPYLVHLNLFGGSYLNSVIQVVNHF